MVGARLERLIDSGCGSGVTTGIMAASPHIASLADIDGHIIEPGDLWVTRLPEELRPMAPEVFRDPEGRFHQRIYGIDIEELDVMYGGMRPRDMLASMGLACAMGVDLTRVLAASERDRHTILDGPRWALDGRERVLRSVGTGQRGGLAHTRLTRVARESAEAGE